MALVPALDRRDLTPELMDDPALDERMHRAALRGLARLNRLSGAAGILWAPLRELTAAPGHPPLRVLDIATGSGDVPAALERRARAAGITLTVDGCDISETALAIARGRFRAGGVGRAGAFFRLDALRQELPADYDVVMCSLFMHHLPHDSVVELLYKMRCAARRMVLVSDLRRGRGGYLVAAAASRLVTRSGIVHADAVRSVRAAFSIDEFARAATRAGLDGARIEPVWPCRFRLVWGRA